MDFNLDVSNPARNLSFLQKTKNQAKKLFKMAKNNDLTVSISNLSQAQEILAQINGFPNWHALETTITQKLPDSNPLTQSQNFNNIQSSLISLINDIPVAKIDNTLVSFISINEMPEDQINFIEFINKILKHTSFHFSMEFYQIHLFISNQNNYEEAYSLSNTPFSPPDYLGINQEIFESFFKVKFNVPEKKNHNSLQAYFTITTHAELQEEHIDFSKLFLDKAFSSSFSIKNSITQKEYNDYITIKNYNPKNSVSLIFAKPDLEIVQKKNYLHTQYKKLAYSLYLLQQKKYNWDMCIDLNSKNLLNFSLINDNTLTDGTQLPFVKGLLKSLHTSNFEVENPQMFSYQDKNVNSLPWSNGIPVFNYEDKILSHFQPASTLQSTYGTLIYAKPGSGKSVLLNRIMLQTALSPQFSELPNIGMIDIGPSTKGAISLLKNLFPKDKQHLIEYYQVTFDKKFGANILDTYLGSRYPTPEQLHFSCNFLQLLLTQNGKIESGMPGLIRSVLTDVYHLTSDHQQPKKYDTGINIEIDNLLSTIVPQSHLIQTWWNAVDLLFHNGFIKEAEIAQRYAMPLLSDLVTNVTNDHIINIYNKASMATGESLIQGFTRILKEEIQKNPLLTKPTVFTLDDKKIVCLDLDKVCKSGGVQTTHTSAIMYMFAQYLLTKNLKTNEDLINLFEPSNIKYIAPQYNNTSFEMTKKYQEHHRNLINQKKHILTSLYFDEFHRVDGFESLKNQAFTEFREGRKWNVGVTLSSQSLNSFSDNLINLATNIFILDSSYDNKNIIDTFNLTSDEAKYLDNGKVHGPRQGTSGVMLAKFLTYSGNYSQLISLSYNKLLLCALDNSSELCTLKELLVQHTSYLKALEVISQNFPSGHHVRLEINHMLESNKDNSAIQESDCMDIIARRLIAQIKSQP